MTEGPRKDAAKRACVETTAVFASPFVVPGLDEILPPGEYRVEAEVRAPGEPRKRGAQVLVHLHPTEGSPALARSLTLPLEVLDLAVARDKLSGRPLANFVLEEMLDDPMVRLFMASDGISDEDMRRLHGQREPGSSQPDDPVPSPDE